MSAAIVVLRLAEVLLIIEYLERYARVCEALGFPEGAQHPNVLIQALKARTGGIL